MELLSPQHSEAIVNTAAAPRKMVLRPNWSLSRPATGMARTWARLYAVMVHPAQLIRVCRSAWIDGRAVATIVWSTATMNRATETEGNTRRLCRPYPAGVPAGFAVGDGGSASWRSVTRAGHDRPCRRPGGGGVVVKSRRTTGAGIAAWRP